MRTSVMVLCLTTNLFYSCGGNKNNTKKNHINDQRVIQIPAPKIELDQSKTIFLESSVFRDKILNKKNHFLRDSLLKVVSDGVKRSNYNYPIQHYETIGLMSHYDLFQLQFDPKTKTDIIKYDQSYNISSPDSKVRFDNIRAYVGSPSKVIDYVSLSTNRQDTEETIYYNQKQHRVFSTNSITLDEVKNFIQNNQGINLYLEDYNIQDTSTQKTISFKNKIDSLMKSHYRLVFSTDKATNVYYIRPEVTFEHALRIISDGKTLIDKDGRILSFKGFGNDLKMFDESMNFSTQFIKLINFKSQSLNESPSIGSSYGIIAFKINDLLKYSPSKNIFKKAYHFKSDKSFSIPIFKKELSRIHIKTQTLKKEYKVKPREIKAFYHDKKARSLRHAFKPCSVWYGEKVQVHDFKPSLEDQYSYIHSNKKIKSKVYKARTQISPFQIDELDFKKSQISLISNHKKDMLTLGHFKHNCPIKNNQELWYLKTRKRLHLRKTQSPKYEYKLNIEVKEFTPNL